MVFEQYKASYLLSQRQGIKVWLAAAIQHTEKRVDILDHGGLIKRDADSGAVNLAKVHRGLHCSLHHFAGIPDVNLDCVEEGVWGNLVPELTGTCGASGTKCCIGGTQQVPQRLIFNALLDTMLDLAY